MHLVAPILPFGIVNALTAAFIVSLVFGGAWVWLLLGLTILGVPILDEFLGIQREPSATGGSWLYELQLYAALPLLIIVTVLFVHYLAKNDPIGLMHGLSLVGVTFGGAPEIRDWPTVVAATIATGLFYGLHGMPVAHELIHRTNSAVAQCVARVLLALNHNGHYPTTHLNGHHRNVATFADPTSARRGEYVLFFQQRCFWGEVREAFRIEKSRLRKKSLPYLSWHNRVLQDQLYWIGTLAAVAAVAGYRGLVGFLIAGGLGTCLHRSIDYVQHYGLLRVPGAPIEARHSWECDHFLSKAMQYNLPLHPDHHLFAGKPFWKLHPRCDAPRLPCGFAMAALAALIPPLWRRLIDPLLADWDQRLASEEERRLLRDLYPGRVTAVMA